MKVYVDFGSTDGSIHAAEQLGAHVISLDMTWPFTAGRARNEGFALVKAVRPEIPFIQFIDGDCELAMAGLDRAAKFMWQRVNPQWYVGGAANSIRQHQSTISFAMLSGIRQSERLQPVVASHWCERRPSKP